ncbi:enoyl-CoA hydratase [Novosphingobium endophyticum]|uniref:Enoyl-CoA hydratase n=1 Tax=Novosphingobium endophyticum TaxID=1955250 RepID=A0A916TRK6_9SPHN|nr:enoyl-CoA hydratase/isomerase family protein [Novosphingobium endophyticum]GGB92580.1 enoyl-CoA hydratase [Novosphingobium endophyticum]
MSSTVEIRRRGHVAEIVFSRPPHNFASPTLLAEIADAVVLCDDNLEVRCTVLASEGKSFCAGADLAGDEDVTGEAGMDTIGQFYVQAERLFRRRKPMVAAVQGAAIGAGLGLALAADFRVAGPAARFSANFVRLGFHPGFAITVTLPRLIGEARAGWMMLSAERVKADRALEWGLADRVAEADLLIEEAHAMAAEIAANAPLALLSVRETWIGGLADRAAAAMRREHTEQSALKATDDYAEGVAAVFERREARFVGR